MKVCLKVSDILKDKKFVRDFFIYPPHKHDWKDETYTIIKGICKYEEYDKKGKIISQILLKEGDHLFFQRGLGF